MLSLVKGLCELWVAHVANRSHSAPRRRLWRRPSLPEDEPVRPVHLVEAADELGYGKARRATMAEGTVAVCPSVVVAATLRQSCNSWRRVARRRIEEARGTDVTTRGGGVVE